MQFVCLRHGLNQYTQQKIWIINLVDIDLFIKLGINAKEEVSVFFTWILHLDELNKLRSDLNTTSDTIECLYIKIVNKHSRKIILNLSYRPPQDDTTLFEKHFQDILLRHGACKILLLIMGNFTINLDFEIFDASLWNGSCN